MDGGPTYSRTQCTERSTLHRAIVSGIAAPEEEDQKRAVSPLTDGTLSFFLFFSSLLPPSLSCGARLRPIPPGGIRAEKPQPPPRWPHCEKEIRTFEAGGKRPWEK